jgi:uncharacterized protein
MLLLATVAYAQESRAPAEPANTVSVSAEGDFESAPDTAVIVFNLSAQESTPQAAYDHASRAAEQMRQALRGAGVDPQTAELSSYNLEPVIDYRSAKQKVVGYRVQTSVTLKIKDFKKVGPIVQALSPIPETSGQSLSYTLDNMDAAKKQAIARAYQRAHDYAEELAKAAGRNLGQLSSASIDIQQPVPVRPMVMRGAMAVVNGATPPPAPTEEFQEQKIRVTAHVNAQFTLQ